jgi:hypothetical protein
LYSANNSTLNSGEESRGRRLGGRGNPRPAKGKGKEVGGTQGRGRYMRGQRGGDVRDKGTLHRSAVALPSYTNTPTTLNQTHVQHFQLKKKFLNTISTLSSSKKEPKRHSTVHNLLSHQPFLVLTLSPFSLTYDPNTH